MEALYKEIKLDFAEKEKLLSEDEIIQFVRTLPELYQDIFKLHYVEGKRPKLIAIKLGYSVSAIYRKKASLIYCLQRRFNPELFEKRGISKKK